MVSVRLTDELVTEIDRVAAAQGQSRSAWIALVLKRAVLGSEYDELPTPSNEGRGRPADQVRVTVRLNRSELKAIDTVGAPMGLTRNEWIKRALRWQLWDKAACLRLSPVTQSELGKLRKQVLAIRRNINQAIDAVSAANPPESSLEMVRIAEPFLTSCAELKALLLATRRTLSSYVGAEVDYWTSAYGKGRG